MNAFTDSYRESLQKYLKDLPEEGIAAILHAVPSTTIAEVRKRLHELAVEKELKTTPPICNANHPPLLPTDAQLTRMAEVAEVRLKCLKPGNVMAPGQVLLRLHCAGRFEILNGELVPKEICGLCDFSTHDREKARSFISGLQCAFELYNYVVLGIGKDPFEPPAELPP